MKTKAILLVKHSASKYFVVGLAAFLADYVVLMASYYGLSWSLKIATTLGFLTGFVVSFTTNKNWVFGNKAQQKHILRQLIEYVLLVAFNLVFTVWAVSFLNRVGIEPSIGKLLVMALIMCWNYALFRWVIFAGSNKV